MDDNVGVIHEDEDIDEVPETVTTIKNKATRPSAPQMQLYNSAVPATAANKKTTKAPPPDHKQAYGAAKVQKLTWRQEPCFSDKNCTEKGNVDESSCCYITARS